MSRKNSLVLVAAIILFITGVVVLANYSTVRRSYVILDQILTVRGSSYGYKIFNTYQSFDYKASFTVLNGSVRSCFPLQEGYFDQWQKGQYQPSWGDKMSYAEYEIKRAEFMPGTAGAIMLYWLAFYNEDPSAKEVKVQVTEYQSETDPVNMSVGVAAILAGAALSMWSLFAIKRPLPERR
jgi:hypothetical protein